MTPTKKNIVGYWHILAINHYFDIISEQLKIMIESGLYDDVQNIFIGCLGDNEGLQKVQALIKDYPKIIIAEYSTNKENYEFQTLKILKDHADISKAVYYGFYIHTKGCSFPKPEENDVSILKSGITSKQAYEGGNYWRDFMNYFTLKEWKDNVWELDKGYETCGTQLRPQRQFAQHYSGNFFWFNAGYAKLLKKVETLNKKDRFQSEFYICSAHPVAATLTQHFVDYNTKGKFEDLFVNPDAINEIPEIDMTPIPEEKVGRTIVHTLCFNLPEVVEKAIESLYKLNDSNEFTHYIVDVSYPLEKPNEIPESIEDAKNRNSERLKEMALKYGSIYLKIDNKGVSQNWTSVIKAVGLTKDDVIIGAEPDEMVSNDAVNWVRDMANVLKSEHKFGVVSLMIKEQDATLNSTNSERMVVEGVNVIKVIGDAMWAAIGISGDLLSNMDWIVPYPEKFNKYGGLEFALNYRMRQLGYSWCFMPDALVIHPEWDFADFYRQWKHWTLQNYEGGQVSFEEFLNQRRDGVITDEMIEALK